MLNDGSRHRVYKRYLMPEDLREELGAEVIHAGTWFVVGLVKSFESRASPQSASVGCSG